jgi:hypothetical protein
MPPKFKKGSKEEHDRVQLLGLNSSDEEEEDIFVSSSPHVPHSRMQQPPRGHQDQKIKQSVLLDIIITMMDRRL